jgi:hypothetical protein
MVLPPSLFGLIWAKEGWCEMSASPVVNVSAYPLTERRCFPVSECAPVFALRVLAPSKWEVRRFALGEIARVFALRVSGSRVSAKQADGRPLLPSESPKRGTK